MVEDDQEVLDWGNEDDEIQATDLDNLSQPKSLEGRNGGEQEDDAVSLGDDEDEDVYPYQPTLQDDANIDPLDTPRGLSPPHNGTHRERDSHRESSITSQKSSRFNESPSLQRTQSLGKMVHALPPKPAVPPPPHSPPAQKPRASTMVRRDKKSNGHSKHDIGSQGLSSLPPDWEERYSSKESDRGPYYYNVRTHTSTWVHPGSNSVTPSQEKNKDGTGARRSDTVASDYTNIEGTTGSTRRENRRRSSPGTSLSYEDRHYRPNDETVVNEPSLSVGRRDLPTVLPPRPASPRLADSRRVPRASSPPRRREFIGQDRGVRPRRDRSPLPQERSSRTDRSRDSTLLTAEDRTWVPPRSNTPPTLLTGRSVDSRSKVPRGRNDRSLPQPPPQPTSLSQGVRSDSQWTASRPRSPPPRIRDASPTSVDPYSGRSPLTPPRQNSRYERSPSPDRPPYTSSYVADSIPQRRAREDDLGYDVDVKRRRRDYSPGEPLETRELADARRTRENVVRVDSVESARSRKRQPLPPQSARFREASKNPPPAPVAPTPGTQYSGVRNTLPTGPSGRGRNRLDDGASHIAREKDAMDVDHRPTSRPPPVRTASSVVADRGLGSPGLPPTGPRAMNKASGPSRGLTPPPDLHWQRAAPPHLRQDTITPIGASPALDHREIPPRPGKPPRNITGSNSTPLGDRRQPNEQLRLDVAPPSPGEQYHQQSAPTYLETERGKNVGSYHGTSSRSASYQSASPVDRLKILPPVNESTPRWPAREDIRNTKDIISPPPAYPSSSRPTAAERDTQKPQGASERTRPTRFGPERVQPLPAVDNEPRKWLTREEAERSGLTVGSSAGRGSNPSPSSPPVVTARDHRRAGPDTDRFINDRRPPSPEDRRRAVDIGPSRRDDLYSDNGQGGHPVYNERPSLEGRLSRDKDLSFADRLSVAAVDERPPSPVKGRRKARQFKNGPIKGGRQTPREPQDPEFTQDVEFDHPVAKQSTPLLARLTEPGSGRVGTSLRDRVDLPLSGIAGLPPRPLVDPVVDVNDSAERNGRRRHGRQKGGRRGGA